jgi:hypothetical protein
MLCFAIPAKSEYLSDSLKFLNGSRGSLAQLIYHEKYVQERLKVYGYSKFHNSTCLICYVYKNSDENTIEMLPLRYARLYNISANVNTFSFDFKLEAFASINDKDFRNILLDKCNMPHIFQPPVNLVFETPDVFQFYYSYSLSSWEKTVDRWAEIASENTGDLDLVLSAQLYVLGVSDIDQKCSTYDPSVFYWSDRLENRKHYNLICYAYYPLVSDGLNDIVMVGNDSTESAVTSDDEDKSYKLEPTTFYLNSSRNIEILGYYNELVVEKKYDLIQIPFITNLTSADADEFKCQHGFICVQKRCDGPVDNMYLRFRIENNKCC